MTQEHNNNMWTTANSVIHIEKTEKSVIHLDWAARPAWMAEFSSTHNPHLFLLRVTLGLCFNSVAPGLLNTDYESS
jgi:hypothetical protein